MNKTELIQAISVKCEKISRRKIELIINTAFETIAEELGSGNTVSMHDFGTFSRKILAAGKYRIPTTGEEVELPARVSVRFNPYRKLKAKLNE